MYKSNDFFFEVARGARTGMTRIAFSGSNADVDAAEDIWAVGGDAPSFNGNGFALEVVSSDADDTTGGTGARHITVKGVDENGDYQEELMVVNGATPAASTKTWGFVNSAEVYDAGSSKFNEGTLTLRIPAGATKLTMPAGYSVSDAAFYYVPNGYRLIIDSASFWSVTAGITVVGLAVTRGTVMKIVSHASVTGSTVFPSIPVMQEFVAGDLVSVRAASVSAGNQNVGATLRGVLMSDAAV